MTKKMPNKWTAFLLSLIAPGAGQIFAGNFWCIAWFLVVAVISAITITNGLWIVQTLMLFAICLCSAEHAKRLCEPVRNPRSPQIGSRVTACEARRRAVKVRIDVDTRYSTQQLWKKVAHLPEFLTIDPFHQHVTLMRDVPRVGDDLILAHNAFGVRFLRFGRILRWKPGKCYAFSDLSRRSHSSFPHVFFINVSPLDGTTPADPQSRLTIEVRGKWMSRWIPVSIGMVWLTWVCREHARLLRRAL